MALAVVGCEGTGKGDPPFVVDTVNGIPTAVNPPGGAWGPSDRWRVSIGFELGTGIDESSEYIFTNRLATVSMGPLGRAFVLDAQVEDIRVFGRTGALVRRFAGRGQGPGELMSPSAMAWDPEDRLWVANGYDRRYTVFDSTGQFIRTAHRPVHGLPRNPHQMLFLSDSVILDESFHRGAALFLAIDTIGTILDTVARMTFPDRPSVFLPRGFDRDALHYLATLVWTLAPDTTIWSAESGELRLIQRTLEGDTLLVVETRHRSGELDPATARWVAREFAALHVDPSEYTAVRPVLQAIHALDDGHVLVQIVEEPGEDSGLFDVFDPDGRYLGELRTGFRMTTLGMPGIVGDTIVAIATARLDIPYLVRAVIERPIPPH